MIVFIELEKTLVTDAEGAFHFESHLQTFLNQEHPVAVQQKTTCFLGLQTPLQIQGAVLVAQNAWLTRKHTLPGLEGFRASAEVKEGISRHTLRQALQTGNWPTTALFSTDPGTPSGIMEQKRRRYLWMGDPWAINVSIDQVTWKEAVHHFIEFDVESRWAVDLKRIHTAILHLVQGHSVSQIQTSKLLHLQEIGG